MPRGSSVVGFDDVDGIVLVPATLRGPTRDTSGTLVLDTGAGALALDAVLARTLGVADSESLAVAVDVAPRSLRSLRVGSFAVGPVAPLLTVDMRPVWSAIDRHPLGLLGEAPLVRGAIVIDRDLATVVLVPPRDSIAVGADPISTSREWLGALLSASARPVSFRLGGDEKILVGARITAPPAAGAGTGTAAGTHVDPSTGTRGNAGTGTGTNTGTSAGAGAIATATDSLVLILDTGATKCVLFEDMLRETVPDLDGWPTLRGLSAPTLFGSAPAKLAMLPELRILDDSVDVARAHVDAILTGGPLSTALQRAVGEPVHGLLGDSFLRHYRLAIDYPDRILWLEPRARADERPFEYCQPGLQIERRGRAARVSGVIEGSPAARARIRPGDEVVAIDRRPAATTSVLELARVLEGPPGSKVKIRLVQGGRTRNVTLVRRWLLPPA